MNIFLKIALSLHIISGFTALLAGLIAMISKKGSKIHRCTGKIFFFAMLSATVIAVIISVVKDIRFLLLIGLFSLYQNYMGYRAVRNKALKPNLLDGAVLFMAAVNGILMLISGNVVLTTFGIISLFLATQQFRLYVRLIRGEEVSKLRWLRQHIGMMTGAYIAAFTAFLVVNVKHFHPAWLPWLAPTFLLTPLIFYWTKKFTKPSKKLILKKI